MGKDKPKGQDSRQQRAMMEEQKRAEREARKIESENKQKADANRRRRQGRSSLITTSELGVKEGLG